MRKRELREFADRGEAERAAVDAELQRRRVKRLERRQVRERDEQQTA